MRTVFFGTPAIAVPALEALAATTDVVGVVCQPDRPAGRGLTVQAPPVKQAACHLGLVVHQPVRVKTGNLHEWLAERAPDVAIVMAYGRILPPQVLSAPRVGCMNLHASLLPRYRGAAPINWCLVHGETQTGISLMQMDEGMDTGPVFSKRVLEIDPETTAGELAQQLATLAAVVVREDVPRAVAGRISATPQDHSRATSAPPIEAHHTQIDWNSSPESISNLVRGMSPRPGARTTVRGKTLKVLRARSASTVERQQPGTVTILDGPHIVVATRQGAVELLQAQVEGRRVQLAADLVNGRALRTGDVLGTS